MWGDRGTFVLSLLFFLMFHSAAADALPALAQQASTGAMTNADVIGLASAGIAGDIILTKVKTAPATAFDTSTEGLKALKAAGVPNDVILCMVTGCTGTAPGADDPHSIKEMPLKEGVWEQSDTSTMHPSNTVSNFIRLSCHGRVKDHEDFQQSKSGDKSAGCVVLSAVLEGQTQRIEEKCSAHGVTISMKMTMTAIDADHTRGEVEMTYGQPMAGMSGISTVEELTYKGACPSGVKPGDEVHDPNEAPSPFNRKRH